MNLNEIKDRIYEAEGLLELLEQRPDKEAAIAPLVRKRLADALKLFDMQASADAEAAPIAVSVETVVAPLDSPLPADDEENADADDADDADDNTEYIDDDDSPMYVMEDEDIAETPEAGASADTPDDDIDIRASVARDFGKTDNTDRGEPKFCLNDRFRFRRAIFGGSDAEFNAAMRQFAAMADYEEAHDFMINDMALDPEEEDVADFMAIIKDYFK